MTFLFTADLLSILTCRIINLLRMQHFTANYSAFTAALLQNYLGTMEEGGREDVERERERRIERLEMDVRREPSPSSS